jgi:hypothetical protein
MRRRARNHSIAETRSALSPHQPMQDVNRVEEQAPIRLMRHTSLVLPSTQSCHFDNLYPTRRQRMNSWSGLHSLLNPNCPIHGRRALIEAYAMNKYLKMSQELNQALAEQERCKEMAKNNRWNRFLRKTWIYTRADCSLYIFSPKNRLRIRTLQVSICV